MIFGGLYALKEVIMCKHEIKKIEDVKVCLRCGMTTFPDGSVIFDKEILKYIGGSQTKPPTKPNRRKKK